MEKKIFVNFSFEGIHKYPGAIDIPGVEFLANPHRHVFHVRVELEVYHDDREIEFIKFKRKLQSIVKDGDYDYKSCEMICDDIFSYIENQYSEQRKIKIEVSEDNENGAILIGSLHEDIYNSNRTD